MTQVVTEEAESSAPAREVVISGEALAWGAATLLFLGLRLGTIWHGPVGGAELVHLSGAWQARVGVSDDRYVPTLFQALAQLLLHVSSSAAWPRLLAFVASATIPAAIYLLRPRLGNGGALLALVLLALEPSLIDASTSASAMAFDFAITVWLFVLLSRPGVAPWVWGVAGFVVATSGPVPLVLAAAWACVALARQQYPPREAALYGAAGVAVGVLAATVRFGLGVSDGVRVPPFDLFAASFDQAWASPTTMELAVLYSSPLIISGLAAAAVALVRMAQARDAATDGLVLLAWTGLAVLWLLASSKSHTAAPLVALAIPLTLILGPALVEVIGAMWRADWRTARYLVPAAIVAALVAA